MLVTLLCRCCVGLEKHEIESTREAERKRVRERKRERVCVRE